MAGDGMHCMLEGLAQGHCRKALGLTDSNAAAPAPLAPAFTHDFLEVNVFSSRNINKGYKITQANVLWVAQQVKAIHCLLTHPVDVDVDVDNTSQMSTEAKDASKAGSEDDAMSIHSSASLSLATSARKHQQHKPLTAEVLELHLSKMLVGALQFVTLRNLQLPVGTERAERAREETRHIQSKQQEEQGHPPAKPRTTKGPGPTKSDYAAALVKWVRLYPKQRSKE